MYLFLALNCIVLLYFNKYRASLLEHNIFPGLRFKFLLSYKVHLQILSSLIYAMLWDWIAFRINHLTILIVLKSWRKVGWMERCNKTLYNACIFYNQGRLFIIKVEYFNYFDERKLKIAYYSYLLNPWEIQV